MEEKNKIGSVLVIGGGIAGIQTSIDLAESGFYVHLVEKSPSIGGTMAQLDKTFPTNDCSMCILSPKLVECGRHLNINVLTLSEVEMIKGEAGNFDVRVRKNARYVDLSKCTGCGECFTVCPVAYPNEFDENLRERKAVYRPFPQAFPNVAAIDKRFRPCQVTCPAGVHAQGYIALIKEKKYKEALALEKRNNPFPLICGRICPHPCEIECKRGLADEPVAINYLKRFIADWDMKNPDDKKPEIKKKYKEKIAIIGGGPAGLSCANYLALEGYSSTVFEALPLLGGMLQFGIPAYRLPKKILDREIKSVIGAGVEVKLNSRLGKDITIDKLFKQGYKAVYLAIGAHEGLKLKLPNEDKQGVVSGVEFLRELNLKGKVKLGKKVVVIGGGNVAIDAVRSAVRLGAKEARIIYRRTYKEMPASPWEIEEAEAEGVRIDYLVAPIEIILKNNKVAGIKCIKNKLGLPDASGRRTPEPVSGSEFIIPCDMVISAIGQRPDSAFLENEGVKTQWGMISADADTFLTSRDGVFAGGDAVLGPATAVEAIAHGREAAASIIAFLQGKKLKKELPDEVEINYGDLPWDEPQKKRIKMRILPVKERIKDFREIELGLSEEEALYEAGRCLSCGVCSECLECVAVCKAEAISHDMKDEVIDLKVGAVIFAPGFEEFDPRILNSYGYKKYPNVVTSIEFERILSASGPYGGEVVRPGDRKHVKNAAFIQCVGSRDEKNNLGYCSSVCCMYAIKEAVIAREHSGGKLDAVLFFMDIRCHGKDFEKYYERAKNEYGVRFIRSKPYQIKENPQNGNIIIKYCDYSGQMKNEEFDMAVLSVGLRPSGSAVKLAKKINLSLDEYSFLRTQPFLPARTLKDGIYTCGAFGGPKDIPETVMEASAASGYVNELLAPVRKTLTKEKVYPEEIDISGRAVRIGVFICHCGINIGGVVRIKEVVEYIRTLPDVVYVCDNLYTCSQDTQEMMKELVKEHNLTRVVVASCSPQTHEPLFQETIKEAGLNKYLFVMANIRDQCSWVHMQEPENATEKAKDLVRMAVANVRLQRPLKEMDFDIIHSALVIGGGIAGINAALNLAGQGFKVYLVEKSHELGGMMRKVKYNIEGKNLAKYLDELTARVKNNPEIEVMLNSEVRGLAGYVGNFTAEVMQNTSNSVREIKHGIIVVAVGGEEHKPDEYLYTKNKNVLTQLDLENGLYTEKQKPADWSSIVMIQCVGSREPERPFCSRVCCQQAIKNALKIKKINPDCEVYILYRDIRTYGLREKYYRMARDKGVVFIHYEVESKPAVKSDAGGRLVVELTGELEGKKIKLKPDKLILSTGVLPYANHKLASMLKVPVNPEGYFLEAHVKLRPFDFATEGIFLSGLCHSPKTMEESIAQAYAAASHASLILCREKLSQQGIVSSVNDLYCNACGMCELVCPYKAVEVKDKQAGRATIRVAVVNEALCKGCGLCSSVCPSSAIDVKGFSNEAVLEQIKAGV